MSKALYLVPLNIMPLSIATACLWSRLVIAGFHVSPSSI